MFVSCLRSLETGFSFIGDSRRSVTLPGQRKHVAFVPGTRVSSLYAETHSDGGGGGAGGTTGIYL